MDKIEALLKGLPKVFRRQLVPVPDTVKMILANMPAVSPTNEPLTNTLSRLLVPRGLRLTANDWQESEANLPAYCLFNIKVVDEKGKTLATGRNLADLKIKLSSKQAPTVQVVATGALLQDFPAEITPIIERQVSGLPIRSYAALVSQEQGVSLQYLQTEALAQHHHQRGTIALWQQQCTTEIKALKKQLTPALAVDFSPYGTKAQLESQ